MGHYDNFFIASAGASAAILGLLVVAVSVVNADDANPTTRELRTVLAGSAFVALVDIFIVSIVALTGGSVVLGLSSLAMAIVGLLATRRLIPRAKRALKLRPGLSIQDAEYHLRIHLSRGLLSPARHRRGAPGGHPERRAATCFGPRHCGFVRQRPWSGMGGHRDKPTGIRSGPKWLDKVHGPVLIDRSQPNSSHHPAADPVRYQAYRVQSDRPGARHRWPRPG